jgi:hypothetical protein
VPLDRFVAYPDDTVGDLFDWYRGGAIAVIALGRCESRLSPEAPGSTARRHDG